MYGPGSGGPFGPKWDFMSLSLLNLGIGSFLFHATLRQTLQFVDDLSMLILAWSMLQSVLVARQSPARARVLSTVLGVGVSGFSAFYLRSGQIIYHVIAFATMIALVASRSQYLYHWNPVFPKEQCRSWNFRTWQSIFTCLFGYVLWNIDLEFCAQLREWRGHLGLPWAFLLELHGWWHILTAIGASQFMNVAREIREALRLQKEK
jgi:dihydroceramidase